MDESIELSRFRSGNTLTTRFTGTLTERFGEPRERIPAPARFVQWLQLNDLPVPACTPGQLDEARRLRETLHRALSAVAGEQPVPDAERRLINRVSAQGQPVATLTSAGDRSWILRPEAPVDDALAVIARDSIELLSGHGRGSLSLCASPTCRAVFVDTSRGHTRRWCDMNTCGNKQKKARHRRGTEKGSA